MGVCQVNEKVNSSKPNVNLKQYNMHKLSFKYRNNESAIHCGVVIAYSCFFLHVFKCSS